MAEVLDKMAKVRREFLSLDTLAERSDKIARKRKQMSDHFYLLSLRYKVLLEQGSGQDENEKTICIAYVVFRSMHAVDYIKKIYKQSSNLNLFCSSKTRDRVKSLYLFKEWP